MPATPHTGAPAPRRARGSATTRLCAGTLPPLLSSSVQAGLHASADGERRQVRHSGGTFPLRPFSPGWVARACALSPPLGREGKPQLLRRGSDTPLARAPALPAAIFNLCGQAADCAGQDSPPVGQLRAGSRAPSPAALPLERAILRAYRKAPP